MEAYPFPENEDNPWLEDVLPAPPVLQATLDARAQFLTIQHEVARLQGNLTKAWDTLNDAGIHFGEIREQLDNIDARTGHIRSRMFTLEGQVSSAFDSIDDTWKRSQSLDSFNKQVGHNLGFDAEASQDPESFRPLEEWFTEPTVESVAAAKIASLEESLANREPGDIDDDDLGGEAESSDASGDLVRKKVIKSVQKSIATSILGHRDAASYPKAAAPLISNVASEPVRKKSRLPQPLGSINREPPWRAEPAASARPNIGDGNGPLLTRPGALIAVGASHELQAAANAANASASSSSGRKRRAG